VLDHISLRVADYGRSKEFYQAVLAPLGYRLAMEVASGAGFSKGPIPAFWIKQGEGTAVAGSGEPTPHEGCGGPQVHVAFTGESRAMVDAFHRAALAAGARDNGTPGLRPEYHANYYGAFVLDPDGHNIEAVCHMKEPEKR
jgi:catechol 2,3-dioxygenase-like lactoylglutathione lyase family enzyme